jgi:hypothetical protein
VPLWFCILWALILVYVRLARLKIGSWHFWAGVVRDPNLPYASDSKENDNDGSQRETPGNSPHLDRNYSGQLYSHMLAVLLSQATSA